MRALKGLRRVARALRRYTLVLAALCAMPVLALASLLLWPMDPAPFMSVDASGELFDRNGRLLYAFLNDEEQWLFPRELDAISPYLVKATIATEDQRFRSHHGVDTVAVGRAVLQNVRGLGVRSGASTLTMQVVKQNGPPSRTIAGKAWQAIQALRLERHATKDEILRTYLNTAPYGLNLVGCEAAARRYFGKPAKELTLSEAALLAGLPKSPGGLMPLKNPENALARRNYVLARMRDEGLIDAGDCERASGQPLDVEWHAFPQSAPHLAMRIRGRIEAEQHVTTTLDLDVQALAERAMTDALKTFDNQITNAAMIVVDVPTASVLARAGSADFFRTPGGGQVDATRAARSPGSALKPFTYALAIEQDLLYSSEMLLDDSLDYGLYNPENYDGKYRGLVSASYALQRSLNVPAVMVLNRIGTTPLYEFLHGIGLTTLTRSADYYGLGLTLGNCEVRLDQMASAYCMLANLGEHRALREVAGEASAPARPVLSRDTCLDVYRMLEQPLPSEFHRDIVQAVGYTPRVCWKTGTSTGLHDAWTFIFNSQYVVAVWLGNNDGKASSLLVGSRAALPLAARVFRSLPPQPGRVWPDVKGGLREVTVCAASGLPVSKWCKRSTTALLPTGQYLNRTCDVHYPRTDGSEKTFERWPAGAKGWDLARVESPRTPNTGGESSAKGLRILAPSNQADFVLTREANADRLKLRASVDASSILHWYLDERFLGSSEPGKELFLDLSEGRHTLTCMTPAGELDTVQFSVSQPYSPQHFRN
ncbi:MAG: penicillin-binding protein 1C [Candidatus Hydrogenedentes bacterium]|nr:penicillin-binding protein 1C [Candidatus Hydrogenedentota bacterium]